MDLSPHPCLCGLLALVFSLPAFAAEPILLPDGQRLQRVDFERHVHALLDRQGCNGGGCHGSSRNKAGGLQLSLLAELPEQDHQALTRASRGRFLFFAAAEHSLLLQKATSRIRHQGGTRLIEGSWEHQLLCQWIVQGAPRQADSGKVRQIVVEPSECFFDRPQQSQPLRVFVTFADGSREELTAFCDFRVPHAEGEDRQQLPVAVTRLGEVTGLRPGAHFVHVFYRGQVTPVRVLVAGPKPAVYPHLAENNYIDRHVFAQLRRLNIIPAESTSDAAFLRRVSIDTIGRLPTVEETRNFVSDRHPAKREKKIDELLAHPLHAARWAGLLMEMSMAGGFLAGNLEHLRWLQMGHDWFRRRLSENQPFDQLVRGVLAATSREGKSASDWLEQNRRLEETSRWHFFAPYAERATLDLAWRDLSGRPVEPKALAEQFAGAFLGIDLHCASCHRHPLGPWTKTDLWALANVFAHVEVIKRGNRQWQHEVSTREQPILLTHPNSGAPLLPRAPGSPEFAPGEPRQVFWNWLVSKDEPRFARNIVNRVWALYLGTGLVEPVGSFHAGNPGHHATLLDALAATFVGSGYDLRRLERLILQSRVYQLSAMVNSTNKEDRVLFSRATPFRLPARVFADVLSDAVDGQLPYTTPGVPAHLRALETVADNEYTLVHRDTTWGRANARDGLFNVFNRHELASACEKEGNWASSLHYLSGGSQVMKTIRQGRRFRDLLKDPRPVDAIADELFQAILTRPMTESERTAIRKHLQEKASREQMIEDLFWLLLQSREFQFR